MAYTAKSTVNATTLGSTSYGAAGTSTGVPGWVDVLGNDWRIQSGLIEADASGRLQNSYSIANEDGASEGDQRLIIVRPAGQNERIGIYFRSQLISASAHRIHVYMPLTGGVYVATSRASGGYAETERGRSGDFGLNGAKSYRFTITVEGTSFSLSIYNVTDGAPHLWNSGSDTYTLALDAADSEKGYVEFYNDSSATSYGSHVQYLTQGVAPDLAVSVPELTVNSTSVEMSAEASGGQPPYSSYQWHRVETIYDTLSEATAIAGATSTSYTDTGLEPGTPQMYRLAVSDSVAATAQSGPAGCLTKVEWQDTPLILAQLGDSITVGGSPTSIAALATSIVNDWGAVSATAIASGAGGAGTPGVINDTGGLWTTAKTAINNAGCNYVFTRIGYNDGSSGLTAAESAANRKTIAQMILDQCPTVEKVIILHHTPTWTFYEEGQVFDFARYEWTKDVQDLMAAPGYATDDVIMGPLADYYDLAQHPEYWTTPDGTHPTQAGYSRLGELDAAWFAQYLAGEIGTGSGAGGVNGSAILGML